MGLFLSPAMPLSVTAADAGPIHMPPLLHLRDIVADARRHAAARRRGTFGFRRRPHRLVGRNGSGKSTLFRIAAGGSRPTAERASCSPARLAYLPQEPDLSGFETTLDYVVAGLSELDDPYRRAR